VTAPLQIAIDGPAASGKTTVARKLAGRLHILYLDTGAMYRALAYEALHTRTDADNESALVRLCRDRAVHVTLDAAAPLGFRVYAGTHELKEADLQSNEVTAIVSTIARHAGVREAMVDEQRRIAREGPVVMAGRDIGTVVLPDADLKIFLTASAETRARRRNAQNIATGLTDDYEAVLADVRRRDHLDSTRAVSPLRAAHDAVVVDTGDMTEAEVIAHLHTLVHRHSGVRR